MSRPANTPRLDRIDASILASEADTRAVEYLHSLAMRLCPSAVLDLRELGLSTLSHAVHTLTIYAQRGGELDAPVTEYLQSICEPLWIRPIDRGGYQTPEVDEAMSGDLDSLPDDLAGRLCIVMVAAVGREALDRGHSITVAQLASLASHSPDHVRLRGREERLHLAEEGGQLTCTAKEAREYLRRAGQ
jgi:hypothetical protein